MQGYVPYIIIEALHEDRLGHTRRNHTMVERPMWIWRIEPRIRIGEMLIRLGRRIEGTAPVRIPVPGPA